MDTVINNFRVVAVSQNANSFGLYQFFAIAKSGEAYKLHTSYLNKPNRGQDIVIEQFINKDGVTSFKEVRGMGIEMPEKLEDAPKEVVEEVFE